MINVLTIILFLLISAVSYLLVDLLFRLNIREKVSYYITDKNEKYCEDLLRYYEKNKKIILSKKLNLIYKINILLDQTSLKRGIIINPIGVIVLCIISFIITYFIVFGILKIILLSFIASIPALFVPIFILKLISERNNAKIEKGMLDFLLQLKNYTQISNDIVYAFKQVKTIEPLQGYINKFLVEVNSGVKFEKAIENISEKIHFEKLKLFFSNVEHCYMYGGDFKELLTKSYEMISKIQKEKAARVNETKSARIVMTILIVLDLFVYFNFIKNNQENYTIMTSRLLGVIILYWNFISIWIMIALMGKVKKLDY